MDIAGDIDWLMVDAIRIRTQRPTERSSVARELLAIAGQRRRMLGHHGKSKCPVEIECGIITA